MSSRWPKIQTLPTATRFTLSVEQDAALNNETMEWEAVTIGDGWSDAADGRRPSR
nr:hypothetical protein [uncultured Rhodopila sp.]